MALTSLKPLLLIFLLRHTGCLRANSKEPGCNKPADIIFVLDASSSIWGPDFRKQLEFVKSVIGDLHIDPEMVRCGLLTYGDEVRVEFGLSTYSSFETASKAVSLVTQLRGNTRTDLALQGMRKMMEEEGRPGVPQVGIVITDGQSDFPSATSREAAKVHRAGITLFAVGIGREVDNLELGSIASQAEFVLHSSNYDGLKRIRGSLMTKACDLEKSTGGPQFMAAHLLNIDGCGGKPVDVLFVLDGSGSIWGPDFRRLLSFVSDMVVLFRVSEEAVHVGVLTFGDIALPQFDMDSYSSVSEVQRAVERIVQPRGSSNIADALRYARVTSFAGRRNRITALKFVVLVTDGRSNNPRSTAQEASLLRDDGVTVFTIGVGSDADQMELNSIASLPSDQHVFRVENYSSLNNIKSRLVPIACRGSVTNKIQSTQHHNLTTPVTPTTTPNATVTPTTTPNATVTPTTTPNATVTSTTTPNATVTPTTTPNTTVTPTTTPNATTAVPAMTTKSESTTTNAQLSSSEQPPKLSCNSTKPADIVFGLPSGIDEADTGHGLRLIASTADRLRLAPDGIRLGLAPRMCHAISGFTLEQGSSNNQVARYAEKHRPSGRVEETAATLRFIRDVSFRRSDEGFSSRRDAAQFVVVIVDGRSSRLTQVSVKEARHLKERGIVVYVIAVGKREDLQESELRMVSGCPDCVLYAETYSNLTRLVNPLATTLLDNLCTSWTL